MASLAPLTLPSPPPPSPPRPGRRHPLLPILTNHNSLPHLKQVHAHFLRTLLLVATPHDDLFLYSRLVHTAAAGGHLDYATRLLNHRPTTNPPNSFIFNTVIAAHANSTHLKLSALDLYLSLLSNDHGLLPDKYTFPFVLKACAFLFLYWEGTQIQAQIVKLGLGSDLYIKNSLIHFYASCGRMDAARKIFDGMPSRSPVTWNVLVDGYVRCREYDTALGLFREMQREFDPDGYTLQSVACACGGLGTLSLGIWVHAYVLRMRGGGPVGDVLMNNSFLDMYSKCGCIPLARQVFDRMPARDVASWNSMIMGFATHGMVPEALRLFSQMLSVEGLKPTSITFIGVLSACNHGGLVTEGRRYFDLMVEEYGIEPQMENYGCLVDLLARAGHIEEALEEVVSSMPFKPDAVIWRSLLDSCWKRNAGIKVSEALARRVFESEESATSGVYILLSRIYASAELWNDVGLVRKLMDEHGIRKEPGCSSVEIDGSVHEFLAGDSSHPQSEEIYEMLDEVEARLSSAGYVPDLSQAPMVVEEQDGEDRQHSLRLHSERLAICFGLLHRRPGVAIRILKNLRMCRDCHGIIKLISRAFDVEIIVRDRIRFHHFKDGSCSCGDYW